ncbi:MAG TPA: hypothetical protein DCS97_08775, partial [Planctomycetes bacterium]|nr:hypothetical protein [Planctomycetota bacterium]
RLAIHAKRIAVNGVMTQKYHRRLRGDDRVALDGVGLGDPPDRSILVCHKPVGLACSHGAQDAPLIYDIVPPELRHPDLNTVGRLDRNTSGLLLLTCDGKFLVRVTAPERKQPKRYRIGYSGELATDAVERCRAGVMIDGFDTPCAPAELSLDGPARATLTISEGRHHQVKRMIAALGGKVVTLHRDRIGGLELPADLAPGQMRVLSEAEREQLGVQHYWLSPEQRWPPLPCGSAGPVLASTAKPDDNAGVPTPAELLHAALTAAIPAPAMAWLDDQLGRIAAGDERALYLALGLAGRRVGRAALTVVGAEAARPGWNPCAWSTDQAARTLLVLALPAGEPGRWQSVLERCFHAATVEELVALYQALPLLPHPERLVARAAEGVRNSMTPVFAAVALDNPFPAAHLSDEAFNQMVLKCFFSGCDSACISGLAGRRNADLGRMLAHYARERRIAGRPVDPALPPLARACGADCPDKP